MTPFGEPGTVRHALSGAMIAEIQKHDATPRGLYDVVLDVFQLDPDDPIDEVIARLHATCGTCAFWSEREPDEPGVGRVGKCKGSFDGRTHETWFCGGWEPFTS